MILQTALLTKANVAVIPGSGFGSPDTIRLSYATSIELLEEAIRRIRAFVEENGKNKKKSNQTTLQLEQLI